MAEPGQAGQSNYTLVRALVWVSASGKVSVSVSLKHQASSWDDVRAHWREIFPTGAASVPTTRADAARIAAAALLELAESG